MSFPPPVSGGTVTALHQGSGIALSSDPIINSGTVSLATIGAGKLFGNPGTAAAIGQDITLGTNLSLTSSTLNAAGGGSSSFNCPPMITTQGTLASGLAPSAGNIITFNQQETITGVGLPLGSLINGGHYIGQLATLNASNVIQSVVNTNTFTASGTLGAQLNLSFSSPQVVAAGTRISVGGAILNNGTSYSLPLAFFGAAGRIGYRNSQLVGQSVSTGIYQNPVAGLTNGMTLAGTAATAFLLSLDMTP